MSESAVPESRLVDAPFCLRSFTCKTLLVVYFREKDQLLLIIEIQPLNISRSTTDLDELVPTWTVQTLHSLCMRSDQKWRMTCKQLNMSLTWDAENADHLDLFT